MVNTRHQDFGQRLSTEHLRQVAAVFPDVSSPERAVAISAVYRASKIIVARHAEALREFDIAPRHIELVSMLYRAPTHRMNMRDLGGLTMQHPASMTYAVGALEKRGLLERRPDPEDRRSMLVELTDAGRELVLKAVPVLEAMDWGLHELSSKDAIAVAVALSAVGAEKTVDEEGTPR